jgi:hypothetical protein
MYARRLSDDVEDHGAAVLGGGYGARRTMKDAGTV